MKNWRIEAIILAVGLSLAGVFVRNGLSEFSSRSRVVTVKGLAEMEVKADKVTWPLTYKVLGNDMVSLYNEIEESNAKIIAFLKSKGVKENEISVNAPEIIDTKAERYNTTVQPYRYNVTTVITVTSKQVDLVRGLINEQSELLKQGVAIVSGDYRYNVTYDYTSLNDIKPKPPKMHVRLPKSLPKTRKAVWEAYNAPTKDSSPSRTEIRTHLISNRYVS